MLVLSRERDQVICIGKDIRVQVVDIRGSKVHLGIDAPPGLAVDREEIAIAKKRNRQGNPNDISTIPPASDSYISRK